MRSCSRFPLLWWQAVRRDAERLDSIVRSPHRPDALLRCAIPPNDHSIDITADEKSAGRGTRTGADCSGMTFEGRDQSPVLDVPDPKIPIRIPAEQLFSARRESRASDTARVPQRVNEPHRNAKS